MMQKSKTWLLIVLLLTVMSITGCKLEVKQLWQKNQPVEPKLLNVELHFRSGDVVYGYVKSMGIADEGEVYNGGSSLNYIYNEKGKIIGSFNYANLEYMQLVP